LRVFLLFVDGLGIAASVPGNPLADATYRGLARIGAGFPLAGMEDGETRHGAESSVRAVDATFGVPGLPQSASGQTALFTGIPAPIVVGRHVNGFPTQALREILLEHSILKVLHDAGKSVTFLNAFRDLDENRQARGRRLSCSTVATLAAHVPFRSLADIYDGTAVYHDVTGEFLIARGYDAPLRTPEESAAAALGVSLENDLTLFEYFMTDRAGHSMDKQDVYRALSTLDRFVAEMLRLTSQANDAPVIVLSSDHGNIEDVCQRTHTRNPVPFAIWGLYREQRDEALASTLDVAGVANVIKRWVLN